jgi:hypothetical protein
LSSEVAVLARMHRSLLLACMHYITGSDGRSVDCAETHNNARHVAAASNGTN